MQQKTHVVKRKIWNFSWWKWLAMLLFIFILICAFLKCCSPLPVINSNEDDEPSNSTVISTPGNANFWFPDKPNRLTPIDSSRITINPRDPLKRETVSDLLNIYVSDTTDLLGFVTKVRNDFPTDSIIATYYAEEYKRVQIKIHPSKLFFFKDALKQNYIDVKFVIEEHLFSGEINAAFDDPSFDVKEQQWFFDYIGVYGAWKYTYGDSSLIAAVIDGGFDLSHDEINGKVRSPWNVFAYSDQLSAAKDGMAHGTHVGGTIIGESDNNFGLAGIAPACQLMPIQSGSYDGIITTSSILDGIFYALKNKAAVINLSLGTSFGHLLVEEFSVEEQEFYQNELLLDEAEMWDEVFEIAANNGTIVVQAAGNDGLLAGIDPMKRSSHSIVVGAIDEDGRIASFSNYGEKVTIYAPGVNIYSSIPNNEFGFKNGTSMATPIVTGCVLLARSKDPGISLDKLMRLMKKEGDSIINREGRIIRIDKLMKSL